jgi:formylglycine-generating enzyme required for sulfatase activity
VSTEVKTEAVKKINEFVWAKYVDNVHVDESFDEDAALAMLEEHYSDPEHRGAEQIVYLGILLFEHAFIHEEKQKLYFAKAKRIFEVYRDRTGETDWDVVEDRLEDINDFLGTLNPDELAELFAFVEQELPTTEVREDGTTVVEAGPKDMILIPAGTFLFGPGNVERDLPAYYVDTFPVTNREYKRFIEATSYRPPKFWSEKRLNNPDAPVVGVSWQDAKKYAAWAGKELLTWEQWEKAARGTDGRLYPWDGDTIDETLAHFGRADGTDAVKPIGEHEGNVSPWGVRDMVGNVWEWTRTYDVEEQDMVVLCGGSWVDPAEFLRLDQHLFANPKDKFDIIGFRCCRPV